MSHKTCLQNGGYKFPKGEKTVSKSLIEQYIEEQGEFIATLVQVCGLFFATDVILCTL